MKKWLVYLEGGPYDGQVYDTRHALGSPTALPGITDYEWTPRRVTRGDKSAQVWKYKQSTLD
jgi:hypothetical protein